MTTILCRIWRSVGCLLAAVLVVSCDTNVINPGRVRTNSSLIDNAAQTAMVNGAGRALSQGMNWVGYTGAAVAREIHPAGFHR